MAGILDRIFGRQQDNGQRTVKTSLTSLQIRFFQKRGTLSDIVEVTNRYCSLYPDCWTAMFKRLPQDNAREVAVALKKGAHLFLGIVEIKVPFKSSLSIRLDTIQTETIEFEGDYDKFAEAINAFGQKHCVRKVTFLWDDARPTAVLTYLSSTS